MDNKILILMMSCNKDLYAKEELACRETFLKTAEGAGIPYYFYKGGDEQVVDNEKHTITVKAPDDFAGTSLKTVLAFAEALKMDDWDYLVKTNVSTWIDIANLTRAVSRWEGREDTNVYGARFLANDASKHIPFPRGHFVILSRPLVEAVVKYTPALIKAEGFPKTDDTLICMALLYHLQKMSGKRYLDCIKEVPSVTEWVKGTESETEIVNAREWTDALSIRCKDEVNPENTPNRMRLVNKLKYSGSDEEMVRRNVDLIETPYGLLTYTTYQKVQEILKSRKEQEKENTLQEKEEPKDGPEKTPAPENKPEKRLSKLEEIRKKLREEMM